MENMKEKLGGKLKNVHENYWKIKEIRMLIRKENEGKDMGGLQDGLTRIEGKIEMEERRMDKKLYDNK